MTIDREGFMAILTDIWPSKTTPESIQKSAKVVGVSIYGSNADWICQERMGKAEILISANDVAATSSRGTTDNY